MIEKKKTWETWKMVMQNNIILRIYKNVKNGI